MARADKAAKNVNRFVRKRIVEKIKKEKALPKMWKGKMIVPLAKWLKKQNFGTHEWRDCYPDQYKSDLLLYPGDDKIIRGYQDEWWSEFCELMESVKDPAFGKLKCKLCILNPGASSKTTNIRDAIIATNQNPDVTPLEFPCKIVNRFECPYKDDMDKSRIFFLGSIWNIFDDALKYNRKMISRMNNTYTVDFKRKKVILVRNYDIELQHGGDVEDFFNKIKPPKFQITDHKSLYDVITTRDKLESVLEEYFDALANGIEDNHHNLEMIEDLRKYSEEDFLDIFDQIKNMITLDNLQDTEGMTLQEVELEKEKNEKLWAERETMWASPTTTPTQERNGTCFSCGQFANVICHNCNIWTCLAHWRDHGIQTHNYTKPENPSSSIA